MTNKKLSVKHYLVLTDKIMNKITHWSSKLLTYADCNQLIQRVAFAITNFWMQCLPLPKAVIHKINAICKSFLWTWGNSLLENRQ